MLQLSLIHFYALFVAKGSCKKIKTSLYLLHPLSHSLHSALFYYNTIILSFVKTSLGVGPFDYI